MVEFDASGTTNPAGVRQPPNHPGITRLDPEPIHTFWPITLDSLAHPLITIWQEDGGAVVFEVDSVWRFPDGVETTIRACSIFTIADGKFTDMRIYVDNSPIDQYLS